MYNLFPNNITMHLKITIVLSLEKKSVCFTFPCSLPFTHPPPPPPSLPLCLLSNLGQIFVWTSNLHFFNLLTNWWYFIVFSSVWSWAILQLFHCSLTNHHYQTCAFSLELLLSVHLQEWLHEWGDQHLFLQNINNTLNYCCTPELIATMLNYSD